MSKATISTWVVKLLRRAYSEATFLDTQLALMSIHKIGPLATSLAIQAMFALSDILNAATWATPSTSVSHYLHDVTGLQGHLHALWPYVVARKAFLQRLS